MSEVGFHPNVPQTRKNEDDLLTHSPGYTGEGLCVVVCRKSGFGPSFFMVLCALLDVQISTEVSVVILQQCVLVLQN